MSVSSKDLAAEALTRILEQFKNKANIEALLAVFSAQSQSVEDALLMILNDTIVSISEGAQLDGLGAIVGEERHGRVDNDYREGILARIRLNLSNGTIEDVIGIIRSMAGDVTVKVREYEPAAFIAEVLEDIDPDVLDPVIVGNAVASGKAGGVGSGVLFHVAGAFQYDAVGYDIGKYAGIF